MRNAHISRRQIETEFDGLDLDFETAQALALDTGLDLDFLQFETGFDAQVEATEYELSPAALAELYDDKPRKPNVLSVARQAHRDANRVLHSLPVSELDAVMLDEVA